MLTRKDSCILTTEILAAHGVQTVYCSPGSRNAPMLLALDDCTQMRKEVVIDERSAAFMALGAAQISGKPVALCCTSGTALLDYAPAVAEAYYQGLPLIVVSADRPAHRIDQDDSQTIRQPGALGNFVKKTVNIPDFREGDFNARNYCMRCVNDALLTALSGKPGPVHINLQLDEPLVMPSSSAPDPARIITMYTADDMISKEEAAELAAMAAGRKVLIVCGFMQPDARLNKAMMKLSRMANVFLLNENISNLHVGSYFCGIDVILSAMTPDDITSLAPDIIITTGGALVSRKIKEYLRRCDAAEHWTVGHNHATVDCFDSLTRRIEVEPARFFSMFGKYMGRHHIKSDYHSRWSTLESNARRAHRAIARHEAWSSLRAFEIVFDHVDSTVNLQISNGTPIRYSQLCMKKVPHTCHCNRGVSGIDGSLSTAIGAASQYAGTTLLITGDMSMAYDIGALGAHNISEQLKVIVINNAGGEIFRFIPTTARLDVRETYFSVPPRLPLEALANAYGFEYFTADGPDKLHAVIDIFMQPRLAPSILEICVPPEISAEILSNYFNNINRLCLTGNR